MCGSHIDDVCADTRLDCSKLGEVLERGGCVRLLTDVDGKIQHIYEDDSKEHDASLDKLGLGVGTKNAQEPTHDISCPCEYHEGDDCGRSASYNKRPPLPPSQTAVVTLQTNVRLDKNTGEGAGNPYQSEHRLAQTEGEQVGLCVSLASPRTTSVDRGDDEMADAKTCCIRWPTSRQVHAGRVAHAMQLG